MKGRQRPEGQVNRERIRVLLISRPGITNREIGLALTLSLGAVGRHVAAIRNEWLPSHQFSLELEMK